MGERVELPSEGTKIALSGLLLVLLSLMAACAASHEEPLDAGFTIDGGADAPDANVFDAFVDAPPFVDTCTRMGGTIGRSCSGDAACDDGCFCNGLERCLAGTCAAGADPCADALDCTRESCVEEVDRCFQQPHDELCDDHDACNGMESCDVMIGCLAGPPLYCNDDQPCTVDACNAATGCTFTPRDLDGDGYTPRDCGGDDCQDDPRFDGASIHPGATERCENGLDDNCDGLTDYHDPTCTPTNDACTSALVLDASDGMHTYSGSTAGLVSDYSLSCGGGGPDAVFRFTLADTSDVTVLVSGAGGGVALRAWDACETGPDSACDSSGPTASLVRHSLPAGDYAIIVQSPIGGTIFDLGLRVGMSTPMPPIDRCDAGTEDVSAGGHFTGMFADTSDDYSLQCHTGSFRDAAYRFTIPSSGAEDVTITASTTSTFTPATYVSILTDCNDPTTSVQCTSGMPATLHHHAVAPGTYYLLIESSDPSATTWTMDIAFSDPAPRNPGDACTTALDITASSASVPISSLDLDSGTRCGGTATGYRDATFVFDVTEGACSCATPPCGACDVQISTNLAGSFHYTELETSCGVASSALRCWNGSGTVSQAFRSLPNGRYYLTTSTALTSGTATASVTFSSPTPLPPNDLCAGAIVLNSGDTRRDTTIGLADDVRGGTCASSGYPDAFYTFTVSAAQPHVIASVADADGGASRFFLTLRASCASADLACVASPFAPPTSVTLDTSLAPGTYVLIVESTSIDPSDFDISFFTTP